MCMRAKLAAMVIRDHVETDLINGTNATGVFTKAGVAPAPAIPSGSAEIPLVIQDKTFVPQNPASTTCLQRSMCWRPVKDTRPLRWHSPAAALSSRWRPPPSASAWTALARFITGAITGITMTHRRFGLHFRSCRHHHRRRHGSGCCFRFGCDFVAAGPDVGFRAVGRLRQPLVSARLYA